MLYIIRHEAKRTMRYAWKDQSLLGYSRSVCPQCSREVATPQYKVGTPHFLLEGGSTYPDYVQFCGAGTRFLVSEKVLNLFEWHGISGYSGYLPITLESTDKPNSIPCTNYYCLDISGEVELDFAAMHLKRKRICPECGQFDWSRMRLEPIILNPATWDGSDLCQIASLPGYRICSERVKEIIEAHELTGFSLQVAIALPSS